MEVIVTLQDRRDLKLAEGLANRLGGSVHGPREGAVNPDAPACISSSILQCGGVAPRTRTRPSFLQNEASFYHTTFFVQHTLRNDHRTYERQYVIRVGLYRFYALCELKLPGNF